MTEVSQCVNKDNPEFMWDYFHTKDVPYSLRSGHLLKIPSVRTKTYGINSLLFRGSLLLNTVPNTIKTASSLATFKNGLKSWSGKLCNCAICS